MDFPIHYQWADHAKSGIVWHGSPDGKRRLIDVNTARRYGLCLCDDECICKPRDKTPFRRDIPGKVVTRTAEGWR